MKHILVRGVFPQIFDDSYVLADGDVELTEEQFLSHEPDLLAQEAEVEKMLLSFGSGDDSPVAFTSSEVVLLKKILPKLVKLLDKKP